MEETFSNDDMASEVLSRLPAKTLASCKCVSKAWNSLISRPSILRAHFERSQDLSGIFFQDYTNNLDRFRSPTSFVTLVEKQPRRIENSLDFLPEKVVLMGSCNGLLCCRSCIHPDCLRGPRGGAKELVIYICNPHSKEWIALRPKEREVNDAIGFAFYPFGSSLNPDPCFKLVSIHSPKDNSNVYSFLVYSSETGKWTRSKDVCQYNSRIRKNKMIFVGSRFHWLTWGHHIITFDIERELSAVIKLPGTVMNFPGPVTKILGSGFCLGGSRRCLYYVYKDGLEVRVWMLKDYGKSEWSLEYSLNLPAFLLEHEKLFTKSILRKFNELKSQGDRAVYGCLFFVLAYSEEVLYMKVGRRLYSYDFRTEELKQRGKLVVVEGFSTTTVLPHTVCMAAAGVLKEGQYLGHKMKGKESVESTSGLKQKRRKCN